MRVPGDRIGAVLLAGCLLSSCSEKDAAGADDTGATDTGDPPTTGDAEATWYCDEGSYTLEDGVVESEHYTLTFELEDEDEALQMARLAEAAYAAFAAYFESEPPDLPLKAGWYADFAAFQGAIEADGTSAPNSGGYYWPGTETAYMYTQPTTYYSRMLFLHELAHQFHFLSRTENDSRDSWYAEGLAEYLSRHDWDGECARLGRLPMLTWEDYPSEALAEGSYEFDGTGDLSRPWAWATYRYLQHEEPEAFDAFRAEYDGDGSVALSDHVDIDTTVAAVETWLVDEQEPLTPIFVDWIHVTEGVVAGEAIYFSMAVVKEDGPAKEDGVFSASHDAPDGYAGIVASYDDVSNFSSWLVGSDGGVWTFVATGGDAVWWYMDAAPEADRFDWALDGTTVTLNGVSYEETNGFTPRGGIALYGTEILLEDISL